jgi:hypothetical protein
MSIEVPMEANFSAEEIAEAKKQVENDPILREDPMSVNMVDNGGVLDVVGPVDNMTDWLDKRRMELLSREEKTTTEAMLKKASKTEDNIGVVHSKAGGAEDK